MGAATEEKTMSFAKTSLKSFIDVKPNKVVKKSKEKKTIKCLDTDAIIDAVENLSPDSEDTQDSRDKKSQGIVIDGRTYTCATCKTGHRVGICKHAKERPMTATHPPGRPPAGAPKKVVCDCPKQCSCKKKDCKCARNCNCTQMMYMLVYVPAPDEEENAEVEKGTWKLGTPVMTDLKGNILTPEQIRARREQKDAQKTQSPNKRGGPASVEIADERSSQPFHTTVDSKPQGGGGCCKHKENVSLRIMATDVSQQSSQISKSAVGGCNCGHTCDCAFCPQHPNNSKSIHMAQKQAMHLASQPPTGDYHPIVSFMSTIPQDVSCMGGAPQFALSRYPQMPSSYDIQRTFPKPGYVIGYPVWSTRTDSSGCSIAPFPTTTTQFMPEMRALPGEGLEHLQPPMQASVMSPQQLQFPNFDFSPHEFGIGDAFVASAGPGGWEPQTIAPHAWPTDNAVATPMTGDFLDLREFPIHSNDQDATHIAPVQVDEPYEFSDMHVNDDNTLFNYTGADSNTQFQGSFQQSTGFKSCCSTPAVSKVDEHSHNPLFSSFSPVLECTSPVLVQPHI